MGLDDQSRQHISISVATAIIARGTQVHQVTRTAQGFGRSERPRGLDRRKKAGAAALF